MTTKRRFPPPWTVERLNDDCFRVRDANGIALATVYCRDDLQRYTNPTSSLTSNEARHIATAIARLPDFLMERPGFRPRNGGDYRWKKSRPYHVALRDRYVRENWDEIDAICRLNDIPFNPTGQIIRTDDTWIVYEFSMQIEAVAFWDRFEGRWLYGGEFFYPDRPDDLDKVMPLLEPPRRPRFGKKPSRR